jgi:hypothetical protein
MIKRMFGGDCLVSEQDKNKELKRRQTKRLRIRTILVDP